MASTKEKRSVPAPTAKSANEPKLSPNEVADRAGKGFEKFIQDTRQQNERAAAINERLRALGLEGLTTREQFRDAVKGVDPSTEAGAKKFVALMELARDFASLTPPIEPGTRTGAQPQFEGATIDNPTIANDDKAMTDLTRQEVEAKLAASEAKVDARLANFDTSIKTGFAELRTEFAGIRTDMAKQSGDMRTEMAELRSEIHKGTVDIIKWVIGFGIASLGAIFAFARLTDKPPAQASVQPAPIVITVPSAVPVPAAPTAPTPK